MVTRRIEFYDLLCPKCFKYFKSQFKPRISDRVLCGDCLFKEIDFRKEYLEKYLAALQVVLKKAIKKKVRIDKDKKKCVYYAFCGTELLCTITFTPFYGKNILVAPLTRLKAMFKVNDKKVWLSIQKFLKENGRNDIEAWAVG